MNRIWLQNGATKPYQKENWLKNGAVSEPRVWYAYENGSGSESKTKYFREKRIKTGFSCSTPWGTKKYHSTRNFWRFSMATLWGRKKFYQSGLFLALLDAYQMGEKFSKSFIKIEFSCSIPWEEKNILKKPYIFRVPVLYPLRGSFGNFGSHS